MKLSEALTVINDRQGAGDFSSSVYLAAGIMPLHLGTFFLANLLRRSGVGENLELLSGVYGDISGNLLRASESDSHSVAVVIEWSDLDPRLGLRRLGGWAPGQLQNIIDSVKAEISRLESMIVKISREKRVVVLFPTLALPPINFACGHQASSFELELSELISQISLSLVQEHNCRLVNQQHLDLQSPLAERHDVKTDLYSGFPYTISHASAVGDLLARLVYPTQPKKGLVTDLDDTIWGGIIGEVGVKGVSWDLDNHSQIHGLYQQLVGSLADSGVLVAVASKNELPLVMKGFERDDILLPGDKVFPFEVSWGRKSESIQRILKQWNIGPEAVVFVDDSPMELAEVSQSHPEIECLQFPKGDDRAGYRLLRQLRDLFGKESLSGEDALRRESLRGGQAAAEAREAVDSLDNFLQGLDAELSFDWTMSPPDPRAFELINKTNQFNLNGMRLKENEWRAMLQQADRSLLVVSYRDKFGPLGKIAVISGTLSAGGFAIDTWVMSCRAFSRRIEYACLDEILNYFDVESISLDYTRTERNGPVRELLEVICISPPEEGRVQFSRKDFSMRCPPLFNSTKDIN